MKVFLLAAIVGVFAYAGPGDAPRLERKCERYLSEMRARHSLPDWAPGSRSHVKSGEESFQELITIDLGTATLRDILGEHQTGLTRLVYGAVAEMEGFLTRRDVGAAKAVVGLKTWGWKYPWLRRKDLASFFRTIEVSQMRILNALVRLETLDRIASLHPRKAKQLEPLIERELHHIYDRLMEFGENFYIYRAFRFHLERVIADPTCEGGCRASATNLLEEVGLFDHLALGSHFGGRFEELEKDLQALQIPAADIDFKGRIDWAKIVRRWYADKKNGRPARHYREGGGFLGWDALFRVANLPPAPYAIGNTERWLQRKRFVQSIFNQPPIARVADGVLKGLPGLSRVYHSGKALVYFRRYLANSRARSKHFFPLIWLMRHHRDDLHRIESLKAMHAADREMVVTGARLVEFQAVWISLKKTIADIKAGQKGPELRDWVLDLLAKDMREAEKLREVLGPISIMYRPSAIAYFMDAAAGTFGAAAGGYTLIEGGQAVFQYLINP